jgi:hypothetical protein
VYLILIGISGLAFLVSLTICISEAYHERDWPRDSFRYPIIFAVTSVCLWYAAR